MSRPPTTTALGLMIDVEPGRFEDMVVTALDGLPEDLGRLMRNVAVIVEHDPGPPGLLGLYEGIPLTDRTSDYAGVLPDRITIYRREICAICRTEEEVADQVPPDGRARGRPPLRHRRRPPHRTRLVTPRAADEFRGAAESQMSDPRRIPEVSSSRRPTMRSATSDLTTSTARADALFASPLQRSDPPGPAQVHQAIAAAVAAFGIRGCAARVAQAYGEHPETAVLRMRWARATVTRAPVTRASGGVHAGSAPGPPPPGAPFLRRLTEHGVSARDGRRARAPRALPGRPSAARPEAHGSRASRVLISPSSAASTACSVVLSVADRPAQDDEPVLHQPVHERRVLIPPVPAPDRAPRIPARPVHQSHREISHARTVLLPTDIPSPRCPNTLPGRSCPW